MKIQKIKRLSRGDFPEAPEWADKFFQILNTQLERYVTLFQGNITFADNFRAEVVQIDVEDNVTFPVSLKVLKNNPIGVLFLGSNFFEYNQLTWQMSDDSLTVDVKIKWDTPPDGEVRVTLLFVGE